MLTQNHQRWCKLPQHPASHSLFNTDEVQKGHLGTLWIRFWDDLEASGNSGTLGNPLNQIARNFRNSVAISRMVLGALWATLGSSQGLAGALGNSRKPSGALRRFRELS